MLFKKKNLILIVAFLFIFLVAGWKIFNFLSLNGRVVIETNKKEYQRREKVNVKVENQTNKEICLSSCYPYLLEKEGWKSYPYDSCPKPNLATSCINSGEKKFFQIENLAYAQEGKHRLAVPICFNCKSGEVFKERKRFYSNEFLIK